MHQAVSALLLRYSDVVQTLTALSLTSVKPEARQQALAIRQSIEKFEIIILLHVWEKIIEARSCCLRTTPVTGC